jgi:hypothetical protein
MPLCSAGGCERETRSRTAALCETHYYRVRRGGSLALRRVRKERLNHSGGYVYLYAPDHPLAKRTTSRYVGEHRVVFYDVNGEGPFRCHWCSIPVTWSDMHVDHLNDDPKDNEIGNLVASCPRCNQRRGLSKSIATVSERQGRWIEHDGLRLTMGGWSRKLGISRASLSHRLSRWPLQRALSEGRGVFGPKAAVPR